MAHEKISALQADVRRSDAVCQEMKAVALVQIGQASIQLQEQLELGVQGVFEQLSSQSEVNQALKAARRSS